MEGGASQIFVAYSCSSRSGATNTNTNTNIPSPLKKEICQNISPLHHNVYVQVTAVLVGWQTCNKEEKEKNRYLVTNNDNTKTITFPGIRFTLSPYIYIPPAPPGLSGRGERRIRRRGHRLRPPRPTPAREGNSTSCGMLQGRARRLHVTRKAGHGRWRSSV